MAALMRNVKVDLIRWIYSPVRSQVRHARSGHVRRLPVKILESDEKYNPHPDILERTDKDPFIRRPGNTSSKQKNTHVKNTKQREIQISEKTHSAEFMGIEYTAVPFNISTQEKTRLFGDKLTKARNERMRKSERLVVLEGFFPVMEALKAGADMDTLLFTKVDQLKALNLVSLMKDDRKTNIYKLQPRQMEIYTDMAESHGILGIFRIPNTGECPSMPKDPLPVTVVLDSIKDSTDLGMLIRTISAVGIQRLIVLRGCVDIWQKSAIRTACGGHFKVPLYTDVDWHELQNYMETSESNSVFLTTSRSNIYKKLQNEIKSHTPEQLEQLIDSLEIDESLDEDETDDEDDDDSEKFLSAPIFSKLFYSVNYSEVSHVTLIISDEKNNISAQCRKFLFRNNGQCVSLPMTDNVRGLNSAISGSVVLYEIHRQFTQRKGGGGK